MQRNIYIFFTYTSKIKDILLKSKRKFASLGRSKNEERRGRKTEEEKIKKNINRIKINL